MEKPRSPNLILLHGYTMFRLSYSLNADVFQTGHSLPGKRVMSFLGTFVK